MGTALHGDLPGGCLSSSHHLHLHLNHVLISGLCCYCWSEAPVLLDLCTIKITTRHPGTTTLLRRPSCATSTVWQSASSQQQQQHKQSLIIQTALCTSASTAGRPFPRPRRTWRRGTPYLATAE